MKLLVVFVLLGLVSAQTHPWSNCDQEPIPYTPPGHPIGIQVLPLPYHHNAFYAAQGGVYVYRTLGATAWMNYTNIIFENQALYYNDATSQLSANQVIAMLAKNAAEIPGISATDFINTGLVYGSTYDGTTRSLFKYATRRNVFETPEFFVNGVPMAQVTGDWSVAQWVSFLKGVTTTTTF